MCKIKLVSYNLKVTIVCRHIFLTGSTYIYCISLKYHFSEIYSKPHLMQRQFEVGWILRAVSSEITYTGCVRMNTARGHIYLVGDPLPHDEISRVAEFHGYGKISRKYSSLMYII